MTVCPYCGLDDGTDGPFCGYCGKRKDKTKRVNIATTTTAGGAKMPQLWLSLIIVMEGIGASLTFFGMWILGMPILIAAGWLAEVKGSDSLIGQLLVRFTILLVVTLIGRIPLIPENETISVFGVTIASMGTILTLPATKKNGKPNAGLIIGVTIALGIFTGIWTFFIFGSTNLVWMLALTIPLVVLAGVWNFPETDKGLGKVIGTPFFKLIATIGAFSPLIIIGINFLFIAGGSLLGGFFDQMQNIVGTNVGFSDTIMDTILHPELAVQAGLKPATTKEVTKTDVTPTIGFTVSADALPDSGCYDSSTYQIIGKIKNTGGEFIRDISLQLKPKNVTSPFPSIGGKNDTTCDILSFTDDGPNCVYNGDEQLARFDIKSIPKGVTSSHSCFIEDVPAPKGLFDLTKSERTEISVTHTCYIQAIGETGLHSVTRLPIEFIEADYGRSKFEEGQLTQNVRPSTLSEGAGELSLGGFEQPILYYGDTGQNKVTMITTISQTGNGLVSKYISASLYIPSILLENHNCVGGKAENEWDCLTAANKFYLTKDDDDNTILNCNILTLGMKEDEKNEYMADDYCKEFNKFISEETIGGYEQLNYDDSLDLLNEGYDICFFTKPIKSGGLISTGKCTLKIGKVMNLDPNIDQEQLRKTLLIRGDLLYTHQLTGEVGITIQDCDIE